MSTPRPVFLPTTMPGFRTRARRRRARSVRALVLLPVQLAMLAGRAITRVVEAFCR